MRIHRSNPWSLELICGSFEMGKMRSRCERVREHRLGSDLTRSQEEAKMIIEADREGERE